MRLELPIRIRAAVPGAEFRAAAYLRAACFYQYNCTNYAQRAHLRNKTTATWESLETRVAGKDEDYRGVVVLPFIATVARQPPDSPSAQLIQELFDDLIDRSVQLPGLAHGEEELVVGSLDVNQGLSLPSEDLVGQLPHDPGCGDAAGRVAAARGRAYLSNVCVAAAARRRGVARALVAHALLEAAARGTRHAYVHVAASNAAAVRLYRAQCGFSDEQRESEGFARARRRPRRLLLHRALVTEGV
uniref:N-acetyltransferase domain-containing protein n=3 Tax=Auxenochlorella protothecoides TaxID=3075 RepID=A0A1D2A021_AUXPR